MTPRPPPLVAHVIHRLAVGGLENGVVNLINHLPQDQFRHAVVCITEATPFAARIRRAGVEILELHKRPGNSLRLHLRFHRLFRRLAPQIVHTRNLAALDAQLGALTARVPVRIHGEHGWDTADPHGASRRYAAIRRLHAPLIHRYIAVSSHLATYLQRRVGIAPSRIERICNGVDCDRFRPSPDVRRTLAHPAFRDPSLTLTGTVGRLEPVKDQLTLARAFVQALQWRPDLRARLRLAVVGDGSMRQSIEEVLHGHGASDLAWLPGEQGDVAGILPALDLFVLPSRAEGISNTILEAMACGVPVVATAVGGNVELVDDGVSGVLVPPDDPRHLAEVMVRLADDTTARRGMAVAARARALDRFSLSEMVRRYAACYESELERRLPRPRTGATRATAAPE